MSEFKVEQEKYLFSLSENDRANLGLLATVFLEHCRMNNLSGAILAVGGTVMPETRGTKRKDIDLLLLINNFDSFEVFSNFLQELAKSSGFGITKIIEPIIDEEFNDPKILRHSGSITLQPEKGSPLEFIRLKSVKNWRKVASDMTQENRYFSQLISLE